MKLLVILIVVALSFWYILRPRREAPGCGLPDAENRGNGCDNCPILNNCSLKQTRDQAATGKNSDE